jgi:hypothetical protein
MEYGYVAVGPHVALEYAVIATRNVLIKNVESLQW